MDRIHLAWDMDKISGLLKTVIRLRVS